MTLAEYRKRKGEPAPPDHEPEAHAEHHPGPLEYLQIGAILFIITALEVGLYYLDMSDNAMVALLILLSLAKFSLVVLWFMHLKFDSRLFTILFATGLLGTAILFSIVIAAQRGSLV